MIPPRYRICIAAHLLSVANVSGLMCTPFFIYERLGGGFAMSGTFGAVQALAYTSICLVSSRLVAHVKNGLHVAAFGIALFAVMFAIMPWLGTPISCGLVSTIAIGGMALTWPALHSWVGAEQDPPTRGRLMGWFNLSWSSGAAVGPLLCGPLYDLDYRLPFIVLAVICSFIIAILLLLPHERAYFAAVAAEDHDEHRQAHDRAGEAFLYMAWCATLMSNILIGVARSVFPKRVETLVSEGELRWLFEDTPSALLAMAPATKYSWLAFVLAASTAAAFYVLGRTTGWRHNFRWLLGFQVAAAAAFYVLGQTTSLVIMALCMAVSGATLAVTFFASVYYSMSNPEKKHGRAAINEAMVGTGGLLGSAVFGYFAGNYGFALPFTWTPVLIACGLAIQWVLLVRGRRGIEKRFAGCKNSAWQNP